METRDTLNMDMASAASGFAASGARKPESLRVWLVDDSENFRVLLADLLVEEGGIQCERQFSTAEDALMALKSSVAPDAILLDVRMPGMGGLAAVAPMRTMAGRTHILMLTTFGDTLARQQAMRDGASDFLLKSYHVCDIASRVKAVCAVPNSAPLSAQHPEKSLQNRPGRCVSPVVERMEHVERCPLAESGHRRGHGVGEFRSNRLVRGVRAVCGWISQMAGRTNRKEVPEELAVLASSR